jgi:nitrogen-specific signal transduction histidine kinase/CheY-like chemotaxis protein
VVSVAADITEKKQMSERMLRNQRIESLGTLSGGVAHDLNNALAPILVGLDLLRTRYPRESELIDTMESSGRRGADMLRQLLTFAKGVDGERIALQPANLLDEVAKIIRGTFPKNIIIRIDYPEDVEAIRGDSTQLHQVLLNLCLNARDAMARGGTLTLAVANADIGAEEADLIHGARPGRYVEMSIRDTGMGIPAAQIERIFEPFFTTKSPDQGTGLGLSTVLGIMKSHGGFVRVESGVGSGSTFSVYIPAIVPGAVEERQEPAPTTAALQGTGETILVVDDENSVRELTRAVLSSLGFKVLTAKDGTEALIYVGEKRAELSLIITDLHMPHMDGLGLVRLLRRTAPAIPVIVASGRMEDDFATEFRSLGVTVFLDKPFTQEMLIAAIKKARRPTDSGSPNLSAASPRRGGG